MVSEQDIILFLRLFCTYGAILLEPIGILCGACGKGKTINSTTYWMCPNCGYKFKA